MPPRFRTKSPRARGRPRLRLGRAGVALALITHLVPALAQITVPAGASSTIPVGASIGLACTAVNVQGSLDLNSGQVSEITDVNIAAGGAVSGPGTLSLSGDWNNLGTFAAAAGTVVINDACASGVSRLDGTTVFDNLTLSSTSGRSFVIPAGTHVTVNGTLTLQGTAAQPITLISSSGLTAFVTLGPTAQVVRNFATVAGSVQIGALPAASVHAVPTLSGYALAVLSLLITAAVGGRRQTGQGAARF